MNTLELLQYDKGGDISASEREAMLQLIDKRIGELRKRLEEIKRLRDEEPIVRRKLTEYLNVKADLLGQDHAEAEDTLADKANFAALSFPEACRMIFLERASSRQRLTVRQLVEVLESRGKKFTSKNPIATLSSKLSRDSRFGYVIKNGQYLWGLAEWGEEGEEQPSAN